MNSEFENDWTNTIGEETYSLDDYEGSLVENNSLGELSGPKTENSMSTKLTEPFEKKIYISSPTMHGGEMTYIYEAHSTNWMSTVGNNINEVERISAKETDCKYAVALSSGTSALHLAIRMAAVEAYGYPKTCHGALEGKKVFCSDMTFCATVNPIVYENGEPIFIDSEYETWNMDPKALKRAFELYPEVKIVVLAHLYGVPSKMDEILEIIKEHDAILVEDAAESLGASYKGKKTGSFGKYNVISFNGNKIITGTTGGCMITDDEEAANRVRKWSQQSRENVSWYEHIELGYNYRMSNIVAGVIRAQYDYLYKHIEQKETIYNRYKEAFSGLPVSMNPYDEKNTKPNFWLHCLLLDKSIMDSYELVEGLPVSHDEGKTSPGKILKAIADINAEGRPIWKPLHLQPMFREMDFVTADGHKLGDGNYTAVDEDIFMRGFCLPSDNKMTEEEQNKIIYTIIKAIGCCDNKICESIEAKESMRKRHIPFSPPDISYSEIDEVGHALKSGWITTGPRTKKLEIKLADFCGTSKVVCLNSATAAEEMNLRICGIGEGDEVIVPAYTYTATASAAIHCGAKVVFIDSAKDSVEMDYDAVEKAITEKTKAIIAVDLGGLVCDYDRLFEIVERKRELFKAKEGGSLGARIQQAIGRVIVMSDCAHGLGASRDGKMTGNIADFTDFSFHAVKNFTTAEGGASTWRDIDGISNDEIYEKYQLYSLHGQNKDALAKTQIGGWEYDIIGPWYKCNMTDVMAAIGLKQLERYEGLIKRRKEIIAKYDKVCDELGVMHLNHDIDNMSSSGHLYLARIPGIDDATRREIIVELAKAGVTTNVHYKPLPMMTAYKELGWDIKDFPNAYAYYENLITLPLNTKLTDEDVRYVGEQFKTVVKRYI